jgi:hypothetical protein
LVGLRFCLSLDQADFRCVFCGDHCRVGLTLCYLKGLLELLLALFDYKFCLLSPLLSDLPLLHRSGILLADSNTAQQKVSTRRIYTKPILPIINAHLNEALPM